MLYCKRCRHVFEEETAKCPICRYRKLREAQMGDICFLEENEPYLANIMNEILQQNGIDVLTESSIGAGLATIAGTMLELIRLYVRFEDLGKARELVDAYTHYDGEDPQAEESDCSV